MSAKMIGAAGLEQMFRVFNDTKKVLRLDKLAGTWAWVDRDEVDVLEAYHGGFATAFEALVDAVAPYFEDEEGGNAGCDTCGTNDRQEGSKNCLECNAEEDAQLGYATMLDLGTAHMPCSKPEFGTCRNVEHEYGYVVFVSGEEDQEVAEIPEWLLPAYKRAQERSCILINFDRDGEVAVGLPTWEW